MSQLRLFSYLPNPKNLEGNYRGASVGRRGRSERKLDKGASVVAMGL
jgi:hypothetical protein